MTDFDQLRRRQNQMFILVCVNFVLFMVLFGGLGYVTWQSISLVNQLKKDVGRAEQAVAELQSRIQQVDTDVIVERLVETATEQLGESIRSVVDRSDLTVPMARIEQVQEKMAATQEMIEHTGEAIQGMRETVKGIDIDNEEIARRVSYNILKGLGDGFQQAAETRQPESVKSE